MSARGLPAVLRGRSPRTLHEGMRNLGEHLHAKLSVSAITCDGLGDARGVIATWPAPFGWISARPAVVDQTSALQRAAARKYGRERAERSLGPPSADRDDGRSRRLASDRREARHQPEAFEPRACQAPRGEAPGQQAVGGQAGKRTVRRVSGSPAPPVAAPTLTPAPMIALMPKASDPRPTMPVPHP